jgi:dTMP kinase
MVTDPEFPRHLDAPRHPDTAARWPAGHRRLRTVALVGVDGSGKTTQAHRLATELAALGLPATYRRNAGGRRWFGRLASALGRRDAEHLLGRRGFLLVESVLRWLAIARTLLRRAVTGEIAVMDRYAACQYASLRAHAAIPRPERRSRGEWFARLAYGVFPAPDVTFMLVVDPAVAYDRIEARGYDHETMDYLAAATAAYRALPEYGTFVSVDARGEPDEVSAAIQAHLAAWLPAPAELAVPAAPPVPADHHALVQRLEPAENAARPAVPAENAKTILLAAGPLAAGASTVGYRVCEAVQSLV